MCAGERTPFIACEPRAAHVALALQRPYLATVSPASDGVAARGAPIKLSTDAARIFKNVGRPGHMGHERVTVKRLRVVRVDGEPRSRVGRDERANPRLERVK